VAGERFQIEQNFPTLYSLVVVCEDRNDRNPVWIVNRYWGFLEVARRLRPGLASTKRWLGRERRACSHYAAVVLSDRVVLEAMRRHVLQDVFTAVLN
jgi:hypothetical protein